MTRSTASTMRAVENTIPKARDTRAGRAGQPHRRRAPGRGRLRQPSARIRRRPPPKRPPGQARDGRGLERTPGPPHPPGGVLAPPATGRNRRRRGPATPTRPRPGKWGRRCPARRAASRQARPAPTRATRVTAAPAATTRRSSPSSAERRGGLTVTMTRTTASSPLMSPPRESAAFAAAPTMNAAGHPSA